MQTATVSHPRLTYDDFLRFPDDGKRHELLDGAHHVSPSPSLRHQDLVGRLHVWFATHLAAQKGAGRIYLAPVDVVLSHYDVVAPDLLFVAEDQLEILTPENVQGAPALVVEVLSPSTRRRDEGAKRRLYEHAGVREYWLVDPNRDAIRVFRRCEDGGLVRVAELSASEGDVLTTPLLDGMAMALVELFAREG